MLGVVCLNNLSPGKLTPTTTRELEQGSRAGFTLENGKSYHTVQLLDEWIHGELYRTRGFEPNRGVSLLSLPVLVSHPTQGWHPVKRLVQANDRLAIITAETGYPVVILP